MLASLVYDAGIGSADDDTLALVGKLLQEYPRGHIRVLKNNDVLMVVPMLYTWAVLRDVEEYGHAGRYCYATKQEALACMASMDSILSPPLPGYTAIK